MRPILYQPKGRAGEYGGWALNLATTCTNECAYCYVPRSMHKPWVLFAVPFQPVEDALERLEADLKRLGVLPEPIFMSFTTDPFQSGTAAAMTDEAIRLIHESGNHVRLLTKNGFSACASFCHLYGDDEFGVTLTFAQSWLSKQWEPGADLPFDRMHALYTAHLCGIKTWVSFEPVIDPAQTDLLLDMVYPFVDYVKVGRLNHAGSLPEQYKAQVPNVDWGRFGVEFADRCDAYGVKRYIKEDLFKLMPTGTAQSTLEGS